MGPFEKRAADCRVGVVAAGASRVDPESTAATQALLTLESAKDLPLAGRSMYRFREPRTRHGDLYGMNGCAAGTWRTCRLQRMRSEISRVETPATPPRGTTAAFA